MNDSLMVYPPFSKLAYDNMIETPALPWVYSTPKHLPCNISQHLLYAIKAHAHNQEF